MKIAKLIQQAEQGSVTAQAVLGLCYLDGLNTEQNYPEALRWLAAAAEQGSPRAMANLGYMYQEGLATEPDLTKALDLLERAAAAGEFMANMMLARLYKHQDNVAEACRWYAEALDYEGHIQAAAELREAREYVQAQADHCST